LCAMKSKARNQYPVAGFDFGGANDLAKFT
jgi:hypothetical protein